MIRRAIVSTTTLMAVVFVAACGSSSSSEDAGTSEAADGGSGSTSCGSVPTKVPDDPDGVLATLPASVQDAYNLASSVRASGWADFQPAGPPPYTVYFNASTNPFTQELVAEWQKLVDDSDLFDNLVVEDNGGSAPTQLQQLRQTIDTKAADVMIVLPRSLPDQTPLLEAAGEAGIPVLWPLSASTNRYAIGFDGNNVLKGATLASGLMSVMGGRGNLLEMQGQPGVPANDEVYEGVDSVLEGCPDVKVVGELVGVFNPATAETETLQFLSSQPQQIDGAIQPGGMAVGMMHAFLQTGREIPPIGDLGATPGALAYWNENREDYEGVALGVPAVSVADAMWYLAEGLFAGRGIKVADISQSPLMITDENLGEWVDPEWTLDTPLGYAPGPPGAYYPPEYLDQFFVR